MTLLIQFNNAVSNDNNMFKMKIYHIQVLKYMPTIEKITLKQLDIV